MDKKAFIQQWMLSKSAMNLNAQELVDVISSGEMAWRALTECGYGDSRAKPKAQKEGKVVGTILTVTEEHYRVMEEDVQTYREAYPAVDVLAQLKKMKAWALANPSQRKTMNGMSRFVNSWLAREQDRAKVNNTYTQAEPVRPREMAEVDKKQDVYGKIRSVEMLLKLTPDSRELKDQLTNLKKEYKDMCA